MILIKVIKNHILYNKKKILFLNLFLIFFLMGPYRLTADSIKAGVYAESLFPIGDLSEYFINASGGGICLEIPLYENFGASARFQYHAIIPNSSKIQSAWQMSELIGVWYNKPLVNGFAIQPSIEFGLVYQGAKLAEEFGELPEENYTDFAIHMSPSFRYRSDFLLKNRLEVELSPVCTIMPQSNQITAFLGIRLGLLYLFN